jgi:hypothetical protein
MLFGRSAGIVRRMKTRAQRREDVFVLRIWSEADDGYANSLRASVTHVASGERRYFGNYGDLCEFLERWRERRVNKPAAD